MKLSEKNTNETKEEFFMLEDHSLLIKIAMGLFFVILNICAIHAQGPAKKNLNLGAGCVIVSSGNGHGTFIAPYISLRKGAGTLMLGMMVQKATQKIDGLKLTLARNLSSADFYLDDNGQLYSQPDVLEIGCFSYLQYNHKSALAKSIINTEEMICKERATNWNNIRYNTAEAGAGIELRVNISNTIAWRNFIGASAYYHMNYIKMKDHEQLAPSLQLGTGIHISL